MKLIQTPIRVPKKIMLTKKKISICPIQKVFIGILESYFEDQVTNNENYGEHITKAQINGTKYLQKHHKTSHNIINNQQSI